LFFDRRCVQSGQIHYYNTKTHKRTWKDPRADPELRAAPPAEEEDDEESVNCAPEEGLDLDLNLNFEPKPRRVVIKVNRPKPPPADRPRPAVEPVDDGREMVPAVCVRCHMLVMMCRASPACPNCKFLHPPTPGRASSGSVRSAAGTDRTEHLAFLAYLGVRARAHVPGTTTTTCTSKDQGHCNGRYL
jgi:hypothetical protein